MGRSFGGAALLIALVAAPGAYAQQLSAEPVLGAAPAGPPVPADEAQAMVSRDIFHSRAPVGVSTRTYTDRDGTTATRRGLIGNWEVRRGVEAGVGLFSVAGNGRKQSEFRRDWSVKQVTPKNENIAAVGMRFRF